MPSRRRRAVGAMVAAGAVVALIAVADPGASQDPNGCSGSINDEANHNRPISSTAWIDAVERGDVVLPRDELAFDVQAVIRPEAGHFALLGTSRRSSDGLRFERSRFANVDNTVLDVDWQDTPDGFDLRDLYRPTEGDTGANPTGRTVTWSRTEQGVETMTVDWNGWNRQVLVHDTAAAMLVVVAVHVPGAIPGPERVVDDPYSTGPDLDGMTRLALTVHDGIAGW